jgi:hypothetical protein
VISRSLLRLSADLAIYGISSGQLNSGPFSSTRFSSVPVCAGDHGLLSSFSRALARPAAMRTLLRLWFAVAERHTGLYLSGCLLLGLLRFHLAAGDWHLVIDPRFPLNVWVR